MSSPGVLHRGSVEGLSPTMAQLGLTTIGSSSFHPISLTSLPNEVLLLVCHFLPDRSSAIALARTARQFVLPAEPRIWRELDIFLNPHWGERPLVQPYAKGEEKYLKWSQEVAKYAEGDHRYELREKIKGIMLLMDERKLGFIEVVTVIPRPRAMVAIIQLIDYVCDSIRELRLLAPPPHKYELLWETSDDEIFDVRLVDIPLSFSALTRLTFGKGAVRFDTFPSMIISTCDNLLYLNIDLDGVQSYEPDMDRGQSEPKFCEILDDTGIRELHIVCGDLEGDDWDWCIASNIIHHCPNLERASLRYLGEDRETWLAIVTQIGLREFLVDLHLAIPPSQLCDLIKDDFIKLDLIKQGKYEEGEPPSFYQLRRLVLECEGTVAKAHMEMFEHLPSLPSLEILFLSCKTGPDFEYPTSSHSVDPYLNLDMPPTLRDNLIAAPSLTILHPAHDIVGKVGADMWEYIDDLEGMTNHSAIIRPYHNNDDQLIHARILRPNPESVDTADTAEIGQLKLFDGHQDKSIQNGDRYIWVDYTSYDGLTVPIEVMDQMKESDGASRSRWDARDVMVGDLGWAVLKIWADSMDEVWGVGRISDQWTELGSPSDPDDQDGFFK